MVVDEEVLVLAQQLLVEFADSILGQAALQEEEKEPSQGDIGL